MKKESPGHLKRFMIYLQKILNLEQKNKLDELLYYKSDLFSVNNILFKDTDTYRI